MNQFATYTDAYSRVHRNMWPVMKPDLELQQDVAAELSWDVSIGAARISAKVHGDIATLSGEVDSYARRWRAGDAALRVRGIRGVLNELHVRLPASCQRPDAEIAEIARVALRWNSLVPAEGVAVTVEDGMVTLSGQVEWEHQRHAAEAELRDMIGVRDLLNLIEVRPVAEPRHVATRIEAALRRLFRRRARNVSVIVNGGTVTLHGQLDSWSERLAARHAAWGAPGVRNVIDQTTIAA